MSERAFDLGKLLEAARAGSDDALGNALDAFRPYLLLIANRQLDPALRAKVGASDVVQQTFLEARLAFPNFDGGSEQQVRAWLRQILMHNLANVARHYGTDKRQLAREARLGPGEADAGPSLEPPAEGPTPSAQVMAQERDEALHRAMQRLPDDYRQVITLRHQEHLEWAEVGQRLGRTATAARLLYLRAIEPLQQGLGVADV
jgi:RNA polymerase sigma-70 factor (ECF subfamily)